MTTAPASPVTAEEAEAFLERAIDVLNEFEDRERGAASAIPKDVLTCGEAQPLLAALIVLIAEKFPTLVEDPETLADLAATRYRSRN